MADQGLSIGIVKIVILSVIVATPVACLVMNKWLLDYAYRIQLGWWIFFIAGLIALLIALLTISYQAVKAALANPVNSLRSD